MNYKEARVYLESISKYGSVLGLENMRELLRRLDSPHDRLRFIHIAGTNGKGSVLAYLSKILSSAGYRTGKYVSPTLLSYRERIQLDDEWIGPEAFARLVTKAREAADSMLADKGMQVTVFELETAVAFLYFLEQDCDIVLLETGLGGRLDASNIIPAAELTVLTSISQDHLGVIGDNLEEIIREKAGIIKKGTSLVLGPQRDEAMEILDKLNLGHGIRDLLKADRNKLNLLQASLDGLEFTYAGLGCKENPLRTSMTGIYQLDNAITAIEGVWALRRRGLPISDSALRRGLEEALILGRFSRLSKNPDIILDGAHNPEGAVALRESLQALCHNRQALVIFGVFADKDYKKIIEESLPIAKKVWTVDLPDRQRGLDAEKAAEFWNEISGRALAVKAPNLKEALRSAIDEAGRDGLIVCYGSLSYLGGMYREIQKIKDEGER